MIQISSTGKDIFENNTSVPMSIGCTFEYNMNSLVDNISVSGTDISKTDSSGKAYTPFKKLFPVDSIIKPFRPLSSGVKYAISGDVSAGTYRDPKSIVYPIDYRTYYPGETTYYKYWLTAQGVGADITITYPKTILTNKIVARFELSHSTPGSWTIYGNGTQLATGTSIVPFQTNGEKNYNAGTVVIYYNGTSWSTTEPSTPAEPVNLTSVRLTSAAVSGKYTGVIELSPRWVVDSTDHLIGYTVSKESSTSSEDILPIGKVSANSLSMDMVSYDTPRKILSFIKGTDFDASNIYLYKKIEIKPYFKLYHSSGTLADSRGTYEKIPQGTYYCDSWTISEFGDISITALDGAKILQDAIAPSIICEKYSATAIIRRLLDTVGFTNYKFNTHPTNENSVFTPRFWWTDDSKPVWNSIQELCRDSQMTAVMDENNILQFYTRDYLFNTGRSTDWNFRYDADGSKLPNIVSLTKNELASANQVKVLWTSVATSEYIGNSQPLWKSGNTFMGALALDQTLSSTAGEGDFIYLSAVAANDYQYGEILYEYNGYLVIDSEIIEYDGIEYQYTPLDFAELTTPAEIQTGKKLVIVTSDADILKYAGLGQAGSDKYGPSGRYRIKTRGCFNTFVTDHYAAQKDIVNSWNGYEVNWV